MVGNVIDALSIKLHELYGLNIYFEDVKQGLKTPCFFIKLLTPTITSVVPPRQSVSVPVVIQLISDNKVTKKRLTEIGFELAQSFEYIELLSGDLLRGSNMSYEVDDDILSFYITYNFFIKQATEEQDTMDDLSSEVGVKVE